MDKQNPKSKGDGQNPSDMRVADRELGNFIEKSFLDLEKIDDFLFRSKSLWKSKKARSAYGGQVIGQALVAASECIPPECHMHSMHSYFLRPGNTARSILYQVDVTRAGRTYCSTSVKAVQANQAIFTMQASFKREEENLSSYQISMPKVPYPDELSSHEEILEKYREQDLISPNRYKYRKELLDEIPMLVKYLEEKTAVYGTSQRQTLWMKVKGHLPDNLHPNIHKCCLAYMSDMFLLPAAIHYSPLNGANVIITSLDHSMWFHAEARADEWMLYDIQVDHIGDGRALTIGRVWNLEGTLITTIAQEGLIRVRKEATSKL